MGSLLAVLLALTACLAVALFVWLVSNPGSPQWLHMYLVYTVAVVIVSTALFQKLIGCTCGGERV